MPFMCEYCGSVFKREREVVYHEWRHTGVPKGAVKEAAPEPTADKPHTHGCGCKHDKYADGAVPDEKV